jgi:hypothetical protein
MTHRQHKFYRTVLWPEACAAQGWDAKDEARRREVTRRCARKINPTSDCDSTAHLNEDQVTALFAELVALAQPENLAAQRAAASPLETKQRDERRRLVHAINGKGFTRAYVQTIAQWYCRQHQVSRWEDLPAQKLRLLIITVARRAEEKASAARAEAHDERPYTILPRHIFRPKEHAA